MSDVTQQGGEATAASAASTEADAWNEEWQNFMGFGFDANPNGEKPPEGEAAVIEGTAKVVEPPAALAAPAQNSPAPQANGEPAPANGAPAGDQQPASATPPSPKGEEVDPALLLAMATSGQQPPAAAAPAGTGTETPQGGSQAGQQEEPYKPFQAPIQLPPQTLAALFEAEDTGTRAAAIGSVLQSMGNAIVQIVENRMQEHHLPKFTQQAQAQSQRQADGVAVRQEFLQEFPYLGDPKYNDVVLKAFEVVAKQSPQLSFSEAKVKVGTLARTFIKQMTGVDPGAQAAAPSQAAPTPAAPKPPGYVANGARPAGTGSPLDPASPEGVLNELLQF